MAKVTASYAKYCYVKYELPTKRPLFEGRFNAKLIDDREYLHKCISYVENNAVKHELVQNIEEWQFTSYMRNESISEKILTDIDWKWEM
jgi:REP element-mobilizing transposase RayT